MSAAGLEGKRKGDGFSGTPSTNKARLAHRSSLPLSVPGGEVVLFGAHLGDAAHHSRGDFAKLVFVQALGGVFIEADEVTEAHLNEAAVQVPGIAR